MTKNSDITAIILAAGKGSRMNSDLPKVMHKVASCEMLQMVILQVKKLNYHNIIIVISSEMQQFKQEIINKNSDINLFFALQEERNGTAHAVMVAIDYLKKHQLKLAKQILILYGDTPLITSDTINKLIINNEQHQAAVSVLAFNETADNRYGRLIVKTPLTNENIENNQYVENIIEYKDANQEQRNITLCNSGVMVIKSNIVDFLLSQVNNNNASGEFYLTDIVNIANRNQYLASFLLISDKDEVLGVNSKLELANIESIIQKRLCESFLLSGVTVIDKASVYFAFDTKISTDVIIHPNVVFGPNVIIEKNVEIKSFSHIEGATLRKGAVIGPFARIRPNSDIGKDARIGNFVEVKNSNIDNNSKINHLSYIGDTNIANNVNIGAGVITCNYDGYNKSNTNIEENVFIGSNSSLIAPVNIGAGSLIAAGSVITQNINAGDLAIASSSQENIIDGAKKYHKKKQDLKKK